MTEAEESRALIAAPTGRDAALIAGLLGERAIASLVCVGIPNLICEAQHAVGVIILADEALDHSAIRQINRFRQSQPPWSDPPIIVLTRRTSGSELWNTSLLGLGQVSILERPVGRAPLLTAVEAALRARTRQYQAREQFAELKRVGDELRVANSLKDELLGLVSHELRTPLTGIVGCASILQRRFDELEPLDRKTLLKDIDDHATRLQRIIENMLVLSRAESQADTNIEPVLLQRILPALLDAMIPLHGSRPLVLTLAAELPPVNANAVFVEQVVSNLVRNSEKYAYPGEPVEVTLEANGNQVVITVADRGAELTQAQVDRMFEAFYRDPEHSLRAAGLGLGLPVCKRLTEVQGGTITAQPRHGGGLEVAVSFRIAWE